MSGVMDMSVTLWSPSCTCVKHHTVSHHKPVLNNEAEIVTRGLQTEKQKSPSPNAFTAEFYKTLTKKKKSVFQKLLCKLKKIKEPQ